jgi:hypothetical protein
MNVIKTSRGAWQISAPVNNGHDIWVEIRTYYDVDEKEAVARFYNGVWNSGWTVAE